MLLRPSFLDRYDIRWCVVTLQLRQHTAYRYPGDNCTSGMANVRRLLVLSLVCLLLCQMMSLNEACRRRRNSGGNGGSGLPKKKCYSVKCGHYCCDFRQLCYVIKCLCVDILGRTLNRKPC
ncbi:hypothetical protein LSAT2_005208 [Lamellibrachia satsuma]|nr:hypothetical protein LSAT2_005208 [Lamellibrachia satsuma]